MATIRVCDVCRNEIGEWEDSYEYKVSLIKRVKFFYQPSKSYVKELCDDCQKAFIEFVKGGGKND